MGKNISPLATVGEEVKSTLPMLWSILRLLLAKAVPLRFLPNLCNSLLVADLLLIVKELPIRHLALKLGVQRGERAERKVSLCV